MIAAGRLRHRITIQRAEPARDAHSGAALPRWKDVARHLPAAVEPLSAREFIAAQAEQSKVSARIIIRHRNDVDARCRILHDGRIYNIEGVLADPRSGLEHITLACSQGVNHG